MSEEEKKTTEQQENQENTEKEEKKQPEIDDATKRMLMRNYFLVNKAEFPPYNHFYTKWGAFYIFIGIFTILYFKTVYFTVITATILVAIGVWHFRKWLAPYRAAKKKYESRPTAEQMEAWLIEDFKTTIKNRAIEVLALNPETIDPDNFLIVPYAVYWEEPGIDAGTVLKRPGTEGSMLYSIWNVQVVALTKHYISIYKSTYDWLNNTIIKQDTYEFFYDDISSVQNGVETLDYKRIDNPEESIGIAKVFRLSNISGEFIKVITDIPSLQVSGKIKTNLDKLIQILRMILRNRRYGETLPGENKKAQEETNQNNEVDEKSDSQEESETKHEK